MVDPILMSMEFSSISWIWIVVIFAGGWLKSFFTLRFHIEPFRMDKRFLLEAYDFWGYRTYMLIFVGDVCEMCLR